jgi:hypothetical protein
MRPGPAVFAMLLALGLAAGCSRHDNADVGQDLKSAGHDVSQEASKVTHDPEVKAAGSDLKAAGHDIAQDLRQAGGQAKSAAHDAADDTRHAAHDVTNDVHHDTHAKHDTKRDDDNG